MTRRLWSDRRGSIIVEYGVILAVLGVLSALIIPPLMTTVQTNFRELAAKIDTPSGYTGPVDPDPGAEGDGGTGDTDPPPQEETDPEYESGDGGGGGTTTPPEGEPAPTDPVDPEPEEPVEDSGSSGGEGEKVCFGGTSTARPAIYSDDGDTVLLSLGGDQIATYRDLRIFNHEGKVQAKSVKSVGSQSDIYLVRITNVRGAVQVEPGQIAEIIDPDGKSVVSNVILQPEWQNSLGAGDEYVIFVGHGYIMDVRSSMNGNNNYTHQDQIGHPNFGDNDGEFDFDTAGCNAPGL